MRLLWILLIALGLIACSKEEIPVEYQAPELVEGTFLNQLHMGTDYRHRLYYDFETNAVVAQHEKQDWDLSFATLPGQEDIRLNSSRLMKVRPVSGLSFDEVLSLPSVEAVYDAADGSVSAIDDWELGEVVYVVDRAIGGGLEEYYKLQVLSSDETAYTVRYAPLSGGETQELTITRDESRTSLQLSFENSLLNLEPPKEDWDVIFTRYTLFFERLNGVDSLNYPVAGVLLNPYLVMAQDLDEYNFDAISTANIDQGAWASAYDVIGYDWKDFDIFADSYSILDHAFAVKTVEGNNYKLQFSNFLDEDGQRGAPAFQAARLD